MTSATHYAFSYLLCSAAGVPHTVALPASLVAFSRTSTIPRVLSGEYFPSLRNISCENTAIVPSPIHFLPFSRLR